MTKPNNGANTGFNNEPKITLEELVNISAKKRTETPGLKEAETAVDFLSRNNFSNTEAYRILHTGSRRLNGGYELALRGKQHSEEHNISAPIYGASLSAMAEFDHVQDGHELITMALKSLQEEDSATGTSLARRIIEGCRDGNWPPKTKTESQPVSAL
tara:strand:- start:170 stop:643 length:474 start_codon:yes stop_codon:yes gene_type:complete